jgi:three-Cys-motif partner protein
LHLNWEVIKAAGEMKSIEIFLNFPVTDMNRNVFWSNPNNVDACQIDRMNAYWGDDSWRKAAYDTTCNFFGFEEKTTNQAIAYAFQKRLKDVAKFKFVPDPIPMRNSKSAIIYYLFFASQNQTGHDIIQDIFNKYRDRGVV